MSLYSDNPQSILFNNRTQEPTLENLQAQVNSLARILVSQSLEIPVVVVNPIISNIQNRSLDSNFVVSGSRDALVFYTIELTASRVLTGSETAQVDLICAGNIIGTVKNLLTVTLALGVGITNTHQKILMGFVPMGSTINLASSGTGTSTLIQSLEVLL